MNNKELSEAYSDIKIKYQSLKDGYIIQEIKGLGLQVHERDERIKVLMGQIEEMKQLQIPETKNQMSKRHTKLVKFYAQRYGECERSNKILRDKLLNIKLTT